MGKIGKPLNAPGYQQVACEREKWEKLKEKHLTYPWFTEKLDSYLKKYEERIRNDLSREKYKAQFCYDTGKVTYIKINREERLYSHLKRVGNKNKDTDDYYEGIVIFPSWSVRSSLLLRDIKCEKYKEILHEIHNQEKERSIMETHDKEYQNIINKNMNI